MGHVVQSLGEIVQTLYGLVVSKKQPFYIVSKFLILWQ